MQMAAVMQWVNLPNSFHLPSQMVKCTSLVFPTTCWFMVSMHLLPTLARIHFRHPGAAWISGMYLHPGMFVITPVPTPLRHPAMIYGIPQMRFTACSSLFPETIWISLPEWYLYPVTPMPGRNAASCSGQASIPVHHMFLWRSLRETEQHFRTGLL